MKEDSNLLKISTRFATTIAITDKHDKGKKACGSQKIDEKQIGLEP